MRAPPGRVLWDTDAQTQASFNSEIVSHHSPGSRTNVSAPWVRKNNEREPHRGSIERGRSFEMDQSTAAAFPNAGIGDGICGTSSRFVLVLGGEPRVRSHSSATLGCDMKLPWSLNAGAAVRAYRGYRRSMADRLQLQRSFTPKPRVANESERTLGTERRRARTPPGFHRTRLSPVTYVMPAFALFDNQNFVSNIVAWI